MADEDNLEQAGEGQSVVGERSVGRRRSLQCAARSLGSGGEPANEEVEQRRRRMRRAKLEQRGAIGRGEESGDAIGRDGGGMEEAGKGSTRASSEGEI